MKGAAVLRPELVKYSEPISDPMHLGLYGPFIVKSAHCARVPTKGVGGYFNRAAAGIL